MANWAALIVIECSKIRVRPDLPLTTRQHWCDRSSSFGRKQQPFGESHEANTDRLRLAVLTTPDAVLNKRVNQHRVLATTKSLAPLDICAAVWGGIVPMCALGATDRPLRAVRINVMTPVRPADNRGMPVTRGERQGTERER
jgi:hypothetical protein